MVEQTSPAGEIPKPELKPEEKDLFAENITYKNNRQILPEHVYDWEKWMMSTSNSLNTIISYKSFIKKFVGYGLVVTQGKVDRFKEESKGAVSSAALKSLFNYLVKKKQFSEDLLDIRFEKNKPKERLPKSANWQEIQMIIDNIDNLRNKIMTMLIFELALRLSEALKLRWDSFNWFEWLQNKNEYGKISLTETKGNKARILPVKPELMSVLYDNHAQRTEAGIPIGGLIFEFGSILSFAQPQEHYYGKERNKEIIQHQYLDIAKRRYRAFLFKKSMAVLNKPVNPHLLRHSKAQFLLDNGMSLESLSEFLGHKDISTTQVYARASTKKVEQELKKYDVKP